MPYFDLDKIIPRLEKDVRQFLTWTTVNSRLLSVAGTVIVPILGATWASVGEGLVKDDRTFYSILLLLVAVQCFLAWRVIAAPTSSVDTLLAARDIEQKTRDDQDVRDRLQAEVKKLFVLSEITYFWAAIQSEQAPLHASRLSEDDLQLHISKVLEPMVSQAEDIFDIENNELWNFALFRYDKDKDLLVPCWRRTHRNHPGRNGLGRSWRPGYGHVGLAFMKGQSIYTADANNADVRRLTEPPENETRDYDRETYVSFAAIPIKPLDGGDSCKPWGALVATSDKRNRFDSGNVGILEHAGVVLANLFCEYHIENTDAQTECHSEASTRERK